MTGDTAQDLGHTDAGIDVALVVEAPESTGQYTFGPARAVADDDRPDREQSFAGEDDVGVIGVATTVSPPN